VLGDFVGAEDVGAMEGVFDGDFEGRTVGVLDGERVGSGVGYAVGLCEGCAVGFCGEHARSTTYGQIPVPELVTYPPTGMLNVYEVYAANGWSSQPQKKPLHAVEYQLQPARKGFGKL